MFDPHRIGPSTSSYYDRNKGRVLQRKVVDMPGQPITRSQLLSYLPIMRLNGIVQTPIVRQFVSQDSTFTFDSDTYLATGSTVTFSGSTGVYTINRILIAPDQGPSTILPLSNFEYTSTQDQITIHSNEGGGSIVFIYHIFLHILTTHFILTLDQTHRIVAVVTPLVFQPIPLILFYVTSNIQLISHFLTALIMASWHIILLMQALMHSV